MGHLNYPGCLPVLFGGKHGGRKAPMEWKWVIDALLALAAFGALLYAHKSWRQAAAANTIAHDSINEARTANTIARQEQARASVAQKTALTAADSANRSATAAEAAVHLQKRSFERSHERHEANLSGSWYPKPDVSRGIETLIGATLVISNSGPDDAHDVRVTAYTNDQEHDWSQSLGDIKARALGVETVPICDEESARGISAEPNGEHIRKVTYGRAYQWLSNPVTLRYTWRSEAGVLHISEEAIEALNPYLEPWEYTKAIGMYE